MAEVREAITADEVTATYPVMRQLRPHLLESEYPATIQGMQEKGYRLATVLEDGAVRAVAGFRVLEYLAHGRFLYVDDLVTDERARSGGHGKLLFRWLEDEAWREGCGKIQLDSGVQRAEAHRFYFREGMSISDYHFEKALSG